MKKIDPEKVNWYKYLELPKRASLEEVKSNYRKLSKKYHPDICKDPNGIIKYKKVQEAYEHLKNPVHKKYYDLALNSSEPINDKRFFDCDGGWSNFKMYSFEDIKNKELKEKD